MTQSRLAHRELSNEQSTMKLKNPLTVILPMFLGAALTVAVGACAEDSRTTQEQDIPMQPDMAQEMPAMAGHSAGSMEMHRVMMEGQKMPMPPMSGNVDQDFASMMTMHHQQAINMIDVYEKQGVSAELKALAAGMKAAQQGEITTMAPYTK